MYLVERDALLQILHDRLREATSGAGHLALVAGEAGIGKTSLLDALRARSCEVRVWWGACDALQTPHPLAPLHDISRDSTPDLRALLSDGDRVALFEGVLTQLQRGPTLFVVEDAHWADAATLDLLKFLGRRIGRTPCLLVVSYRDDEVGATHPLRRLMGELPASVLTRIDVPPLTSAGVDALAQRALRASAGLHATTRGNPFFVTELLRQGIDGVPRGVQDLVLARFARLSREAQDIVRLASVVPARIERRLVDELLAPDAAAVEECLDSGLLVAVPDALAFRHELARVAVESALSAPAAQALHARVLRALLDMPAVSLARVVHHATHAGDTAAVLRHAPQAAQQAAQRGAHKEAAAHLRTALEHAAALSEVEQAELFDRLSYECYLTERIADAIAARESALARWRAVNAHAKAGDALRWLSRLNWYHGNSSAARDYAEQAISVLQALPPGRELAMAYSNRSQLHMLAGEGEAARAWGAKAIALASEIGDLETQIHALNNIGAAKCAEGDASGIADLERSLALALEHGYEEHAARAYTNLGYDTGAKGDYATAETYLERGIAFCEPRDLESWARYMSAYRCEVALWQGDFARAAERTEHVLRLPGLAPVSRMLALVVQGRLRARRGEANALAPLDEALALALPTAEFMRVGPVAAARAEAAWLRGDRQAIGPEIATAWHFFQGTTYLSWVVGELVWWRHRGCGSDTLVEDVLRHCAEPFALQIAGRWRDAAVAWAARGCPYERARVLADGDSQAQLEALAEFERLGARVDAERLRKILQEAGVRGVPRGQRASTQAHPHALTAREAQVLELLCAGMKNADIAARLSRSVRTIDHHVAAIIAKLGVASRAEAIAAALRAGLAAPK